MPISDKVLGISCRLFRDEPDKLCPFIRNFRTSWQHWN